MAERPMHKVGCACLTCTPPREPSWRQAVTLLALVASGLGLAWWGR